MWRIYYGDGTTLDGDGPLPIGVETRGVQVIVQSHPDVGWYTQCNTDYYVWRDGRWWGVDLFGLFDFLMASGLVLFGRTLTTAEFHEIMEHANQDLTWGKKNGYLRRALERVDGST